MTDLEAMRRALDLARRGWGRVNPNPMVGAVVVKEGQVVGEGFHAEFGGPHAEVAALTMAGDRAAQGTLFVTLEPCRHAGKQPPCADAVIASGVARVVAAMPDPNPPASGGMERIRAAGILGEVGLGRDEAERLNAGYLRNAAGSPRPFVTIKLATSLDHRIADSAGVSRWISGEEARDWVHWFRTGFGAIGVGGRTAQVDDPSLTARGMLEPRIRPARVVFLGRHRPGLDSELVKTARAVPTIFIAPPTAIVDRDQLTDRGVTLVDAESLEEGLVELKRRGIDSIVIEGGGRLAGALLAADLVDRMALIVSPVWLGDSGVPATRGFQVPSLLQADRWVTIERRALGQDSLLLFDRR
jgi:diaminohydroxyphosphoribosylaminopyrimidine deaminase/5-amino-6-(5-phosphoribosylamino)uracil reductase